MRELTDDEADTVMANIHPEYRRWCDASCGTPPGKPIIDWACCCVGCIYGALSWEDFVAWQEREANREPTPYIDCREQRVLTLAERLEAFKAKKEREKGTGA